MDLKTYVKFKKSAAGKTVLYFMSGTRLESRWGKYIDAKLGDLI